MEGLYVMDYAIPVIVGICLCVGYIIKNISTNKKRNRFIPLIMGILGVTLNIWMQGKFTPDVLLAGLCSGLASTGVHELGRGLCRGSTKNQEEEK